MTVYETITPQYTVIKQVSCGHSEYDNRYVLLVIVMLTIVEIKYRRKGKLSKIFAHTLRHPVARYSSSS